MFLIYRTETFAKLFFIVSFTGLFMYVALAFYSFHTAYSNMAQIEKQHHLLDKMSKQHTTPPIVNLPKYILVWKVGEKLNIEENQTPFIKYKCPNVNCLITSNKLFFNENYTNFDAIIFDMSAQKKWQPSLLPEKRLPHQKYVFYSKLPSNIYPICNVNVNNFFNWTWTYKLNSDIVSTFIHVKNASGFSIGPDKNLVWPKRNVKVSEFESNNKEYKELKVKTKAAIWILKDCQYTKTDEFSVWKLQKALRSHGLAIDIFGCGNKVCPKEGCLNQIEKNYYFYVVLEPSMTEDYVTDEVLIAFDNKAVPIIIGGADYSKFLPEHSYIACRGVSEESVAGQIAYSIITPQKYQEFFTWKKLFSISKPNGQDYCKLCELLNKPINYSSYENFRKWWYPSSLEDKCPQKEAEKNMERSYSTKTAGIKSKLIYIQ